MQQLINYPSVLAALTLLLLGASAWLGALLRRRRAPDETPDHDFTMILGATLTLLGLLIGFSFSMAINRYELRKDYEEEEANAIGTEYLRAGLLPDPVRSQVRRHLVHYLDLRIRRFEARPSTQVAALMAETTQVQNAMWELIQSAALASPSPLTAAVATGMNDVINRQGYTQAARWNRIPLPAWALMACIAMFSNFLIGFNNQTRRRYLLFVLPLTMAVSFLLIADIDSPQGGFIRVAPENLLSLAESLRAH